MSNKSGMIIGIISVIIVALFLIFNPFFGKNKGVDLKTVRIGIQDNAFSTPIILAQIEGFFKKHGIQAELVGYPSGKLATIGLFNGDVDIATASDVVITRNAVERKDFQILCRFATSSRPAWIVARRDRGIEKLEDLAGKTIATQRYSAVHFFLHSLLHTGEIHEDRVVEFYPAVELPDKIISGEVDAISMRNPYNKIAMDGLGDNGVEIFEPFAYTSTFDLIAKKDYITQNKALIENIVRALFQAEEFINEDNQKAQDLIVDYFGGERSEGVRDDWKYDTFHIDLPQSLLVLMEDEIDWLVEDGLIHEAKIPNFLDYMYFDALDAIAPERISVIR